MTIAVFPPVPANSNRAPLGYAEVALSGLRMLRRIAGGY